MKINGRINGSRKTLDTICANHAITSDDAKPNKHIKEIMLKRNICFHALINSMK